MNRSLSLLFLLVLSTLAVAEVAAQHVRPDRTLFLRPHAGFGSFVGDKNNSFLSFDGSFPYTAGLELGYQFSPRFSLGGGYVLENNVQLSSLTGSDLRHAGQFVGRYLLGGRSRLAPYLQGGGFVSVGKIVPQGSTVKEQRTAYGPQLGLGLDVPVSGRISLFLETNMLAAFPGDALDGVDAGGLGNFDLRSSFGTGLKVSFRSSLVPARVVAITGPRELRVGEEGIYAATVDDRRATRPVEYRWEWGDGRTSTGTDVRHVYATTGTYTVRFTTSNRAGARTETMTVRVTEPPVAASILGITATPADPDTETPVRFSANVRGDAPLSFRWDFGDGSTSTETSPTHRFGRDGTYTITLAVTNPIGDDERTTNLHVRRFEAEICSEIEEMSSVFFATNGSTLTAEGRGILRDNASILKECPNMNLRIEGHAGPGERQPQRLSEARAQAVEAYYREEGIAVTRMQTVGLGATRGMTGKKDGAHLNQRVDTIPLR